MVDGKSNVLWVSPESSGGGPMWSVLIKNNRYREAKKRKRKKRLKL